jgi:RNA polymerase sigma-70 factor (ECF subfamily)
LIQRIRRRDPVALGLFIEAKRGGLLAYIDRETGTALRRKIEPEDILQELSVDAVKSLAAIDLESADLFGWLCQIAKRRIIDAHRRFFDAEKRNAGRETPLDSHDTQHVGLIDLLVVSMTSPSQAFSRNQREFRLQRALEDLPPECREALRLRYVEGLPSKEIAARFGKSDGAVRVMLTRSIKKLQTLLGDA